VTDLTTVHDFDDKYVTVWTNQSPRVYKIDKDSTRVVVDVKGDVKKPLGLVFGVYGIRTVDNEKITHPCGTVIIDVSKLTADKANDILSSVMDHSSPVPKTGTIHLNIKINGLPKHPVVTMGEKTLVKLHQASEANLSQIQPFNNNGFLPLQDLLQRMHSPYYTTNIGIQLPSGAFLLNTGIDHAGDSSHLKRLYSVLHCVGWSPQTFIKTVRSIDVDNDDTKIALNVLSNTLTMHSVQCLKYVSDIQFKGAAEIPTDRWDCPRYSNNFVGDCEDCSKEIFIETDEWRNMQSEDELVKAFQTLLSLYVPLVVQGCVYNQGKYMNHIWAALVSAADFNQRVDDADITSASKTHLPTLLLEGTAATHSLKMTKSIKNEMLHCVRRIRKQENIFEHICYNDVQPDMFYKYVVACMTPRWKKLGVLDFTYVANGTYGVTFDDWWDGKYTMVPSCKHSKNTLKLMEQVVSYDKPVPPLVHCSDVVETAGSKHFPSCENITFGYRLTNDTFHKNVQEAVSRLRKKGWAVTTNVIDHGVCKWVDCSFVHVVSDKTFDTAGGLFLL
jgi:hypothetical protein